VCAFFFGKGGFIKLSKLHPEEYRNLELLGLLWKTGISEEVHSSSFLQVKTQETEKESSVLKETLEI
jgi:hypothetical protein